MTTRLESADLKEMTMEWPICTFSDKNGISRNSSQIDNTYLKTSFTEIRTPLFCVADVYTKCHTDTTMYAKADAYNAVWFCAILQGNTTCFYNPITRSEEWSEGKANFLTFDGEDCRTCLYKNAPIRMQEMMISFEYMETLASQYPNLLGDDIFRILEEKYYKAFRNNKPICPGIRSALNDIMQSHISGNAASMYADAKVREILSLFLCRSDEEKCVDCPCYTAGDNEKLRHAKAIIEQQYLSPPSLHQLALMAGTNECKLKKGFKALFGTTVFGYLFDYRMDMACQYLLDTDKTVQEIGFCVGYEHHSHFSTAFKRKFGVSPLEYRNVGLQRKAFA